MSQELFDKAAQLEEDGQTESALEIWREVVLSNPTRNAFLRYGAAAKKLGLLPEAEQAFRRALDLDDRSQFALTQLGIVALDRHDYEDAENLLRRASELIQDDPGLFVMLGSALWHLGRDLEAEEAYREAIRIDPEYEEAYFNLGVLFRNHRSAEARTLFERALKLDPCYGAAHRELGFQLIKLGDSTEAEEHIRRSIEIEPEDAWAHVYLGSHLWDNDSDSAVKAFQKARQLCPKWTVPLGSLGNIHEFVLRDYGQARAFFESALQLDPDDTVTLTNIGRLHRKLGNFDQAQRFLRHALALDPANEKAQNLLAEIVTEAYE